MIPALALALLGMQETPGEEIVIAGKARPLHLSVHRDSQRRVRACQVARSSGDETFDRLTCEMVAACSREADRSREAVQACTQTQMTAVINDQSGTNANP